MSSTSERPTPNGRRAPRAFRVGLRRELASWVRDGVVDERTAASLSNRYALADLAQESGHQVATSIFTIGSLLIGGGLIAFVAAHWTNIPIPGKVTLLFAALLALHATGYRFLLTSPRLGSALIFTGTLAFGANLALLGQMFQIQRDQPEWMAAWALGALAMALARTSASNAAVALVTSYVWFALSAGDHPRLWPVYPALLAIVMLPLARASHNLALHLGVLLAIGLAFVTATGVHAESLPSVGLAAVAGSLLVWSVGHFLRSTEDESWAFPTALFGAVLLAITSYVFSFHELHRQPTSHDGVRITGALAGLLVAVLALVIMGWLRRPPSGARRTTTIAILAAGALLEVSLLVSGSLAPLLANVGALLVAAVGIGNGVREESRAAFWLGTLFAVLLVLTRFFEYESSLLMKSLVFIACGIAVVLVGVRFEAFLRTRESARA